MSNNVFNICVDFDFSISLWKSVEQIITIRDYLQRNVSLSNFLELKKWENILLELVCLTGILFHILLKPASYLIFVNKKIKLLLLNVLLYWWWCSWSLGGKEHKPSTRSECFSAIIQHAETTDHDIHPKYVELKEIGVNSLSQRLFMESWHSQADKNATYEQKPFPNVYKSFVKPA